MSIPAAIEQEKADHVVQGLGKGYAASINEPIIKDRYAPEPGKPALSFPKKSRFFHPAIVSTSALQRARNSTWKMKKRGKASSPATHLAHSCFAS